MTLEEMSMEELLQAFQQAVLEVLYGKDGAEEYLSEIKEEIISRTPVETV